MTTRPALPDGVRIYATGDIHGRADLLHDVFERIEADLQHRPVASSIEVYIGDLIDRGPDSQGVISALIERRRSRKVVAIRGNHEEMLVRAIQHPTHVTMWMQSGGLDTIKSYGVRLPKDWHAAQHDALASAILSAMPRDHIEFLAGLPVRFECGTYLFVHAGVRPGTALDKQSPEDLLWIRDDFLDYEGDLGAIVVHGHTPVAAIDVHLNRINIDTGAYFTNVLSCVVLEGESIARLSW